MYMVKIFSYEFTKQYYEITVDNMCSYNIRENSLWTNVVK